MESSTATHAAAVLERKGHLVVGSRATPVRKPKLIQAKAIAINPIDVMNRASGFFSRDIPPLSGATSPASSQPWGTQ